MCSVIANPSLFAVAVSVFSQVGNSHDFSICARAQGSTQQNPAEHGRTTPCADLSASVPVLRILRAARAARCWPLLF